MGYLTDRKFNADRSAAENLLNEISCALGPGEDRNVYICCDGYDGSHGEVINWLCKGISSCLSTIDMWANNHAADLYIKISDSTPLGHYLVEHDYGNVFYYSGLADRVDKIIEGIR